MISSCGEDATEGHVHGRWVLKYRKPITPTAPATPGPLSRSPNPSAKSPELWWFPCSGDYVKEATSDQSADVFTPFPGRLHVIHRTREQTPEHVDLIAETCGSSRYIGCTRMVAGQPTVNAIGW
jgi:hypothetical protein